MVTLRIATCLLLFPFITNCVASEDELATDQLPPDEIAAEETTSTTTQGILGSDTCRNTDIYITNSRTRDGVDTAIEVRSVEYYSASEGKWYAEDLGDLILNHSTQGYWLNEDLAHAENDLITQWRVFYRYASGGSWSGVVYKQIDTPNETCIADANFYMTVE